MNMPPDPLKDLPPEILKKMMDEQFIHFKSAFFRATGPTPAGMNDVRFNTGYRVPEAELDPEDIEGVVDNGVWRPISFKIEHEYDVTFGNPFFAQDYARTVVEENRRRFAAKIVGIGFNPITAKKWLEPTYKVADGESDGMVFGKPTIIRFYIPCDVVLLTFNNGNVSMIKIIEADNGQNEN